MILCKLKLTWPIRQNQRNGIRNRIFNYCKYSSHKHVPMSIVHIYKMVWEVAGTNTSNVIGWVGPGSRLKN